MKEPMLTNMNSNRMSLARLARSAERDVYERLSRRIEQFAEREGQYSNAERIRLMRVVAFADLEGW